MCQDRPGLRISLVAQDLGLAKVAVLDLQILHSKRSVLVQNRLGAGLDRALDFAEHSWLARAAAAAMASVRAVCWAKDALMSAVPSIVCVWRELNPFCMRMFEVLNPVCAAFWRLLKVAGSG